MPWLRVFNGEWEPERFELDPLVRVTVGRVPEAELRVIHDTIARRHLRLERRGAQWWVADMGSTNGTQVNGALIREDWRLEHEDVVSVIDFGFVFETRVEERNPSLEAAILERPADAAAVGVWTDWLLERGDPLGERLAWAAKGERRHPALGGGFDGEHHLWHGNLGFKNGLLDSLELRSNGQNARLKMLLSRLFALRSARFLRELRLDLAGFGGLELLSELAPLLDRLPKSLEVLDLGYVLDRPDVVLSDAQAARLPRLRDRRVQRGRARAVLIAGTVTWEVTPELSIDVRGGRASVSRRGPAGINGWAGDDQAIFGGARGCWLLHVGYPVQPQVTVNGRQGHAHTLLPGDRLQAGETLFRFELL